MPEKSDFEELFGCKRPHEEYTERKIKEFVERVKKRFTPHVYGLWTGGEICEILDKEVENERISD